MITRGKRKPPVKNQNYFRWVEPFLTCVTGKKATFARPPQRVCVNAVFCGISSGQHVCRTKLSPQKNNRYEQWFEKRKKRIRKTIQNVPEKILSPSSAAQNFSPAPFLKLFTTQDLHKKSFLTARLCRGSHANISGS